MNTRLFTALCEDMGSEHSEHHILLFHTDIWWLSKGNMLGRLFELGQEVILFLENSNQKELINELTMPQVQVSIYGIFIRHIQWRIQYFFLGVHKKKFTKIYKNRQQ